MHQTLPELLSSLAASLTRRGWHCATAESCTGGLIAAAITGVPGASTWYNGGIISYTNAVKHELLGVPEEMIARYGVVSAPVVGQMALGAARATGSRAAVSTSGIAGPDGGTTEHPVGTVWIGVAIGETTVAECHHFHGDRNAVRTQAATAALALLAASVDRIPDDAMPRHRRD